MAYKETQHDYASSMVGAAYLDAPKQHFNAVEHTQQVLQSAAVLSQRIQSMVSRLVGPMMEAAGEGDTCQSSRPGIFPALHLASEDTGYAIRKANEALDRLEKELA